MGHLTRAFGQDWYRVEAEEATGATWADDVPDWVDPRPLSFNQPPQRDVIEQSFFFRLNHAKMEEYWDRGFFFDRAAPEFVTRAKYERRHPGILARDAPEANEPARRARIRRERRMRKIQRAIHRREQERFWSHFWSTAPADLDEDDEVAVEAFCAVRRAELGLDHT
jgi:hypothetical protein